nr:hypothetical protein Itr_chr12CG09020 [Ipomoea trifida]
MYEGFETFLRRKMRRNIVEKQDNKAVGSKRRETHYTTVDGK